MAFYYPKNKIKENQYTSGKEYAYSSGVEYVGYYYVLSNGKIFSGKNPQEPFSKELIPYSEIINNIVLGSEVSRYNNLVRDTPINQIQQFQPIPVYYPVLTREDYKLGIITRYFYKKINSNYKTIKEINQEVYTSILNKEKTYDYISNIVTKLPWKISGPLHDEYQNNILINPGIIDTNKRQIQIAERNFPGLSNYLVNPAEFSLVGTAQEGRAIVNAPVVGPLEGRAIVNAPNVSNPLEGRAIVNFTRTNNQQ